MKKKNIIYNLLFILSLSFYNTLYKYLVTKERLLEFNSPSFFGSSFTSSSEVKPPYLKIFIYSFISIIAIETILIFVLYFINKKRINKSLIFNNISNYLLFLLFIIMATSLLFLNRVFSLIILFIGLIIYIYITYKKVNDKKSFIIIILFLLLLIYLLFLISS